MQLKLRRLPSFSIYTVCCMLTQWYSTFQDPINCSQPGSSIHGILQARIWERVAISFSILENSLVQYKFLVDRFLSFSTLYMSFYCLLVSQVFDQNLDVNLIENPSCIIRHFSLSIFSFCLLTVWEWYV